MGPRGSAVNFGDQLTFDEFDAKEELDQGWNGEKWGLCCMDRATKWRDCIATKAKSGPEMTRALMEFTGSEASTRLCYADGSPALTEAVHAIGAHHGTRAPGAPKNNPVAERNVRDIKEGIASCAKTAGTPNCYWPDCARCYCFNRNTDIQRGESSYNLRFGEGHFEDVHKKETFPFGCLVNFKPQQNRDREYREATVPRAIPGIFWGYKLNDTGRFSGYYYCVALTDFENYGRITWNPKQISVQQTSFVTRDGGQPVFYPLQLRWQYINQTLPGVEGVNLPAGALPLGDPTATVTATEYRTR